MCACACVCLLSLPSSFPPSSTRLFHAHSTQKTSRDVALLLPRKHLRGNGKLVYLVPRIPGHAGMRCSKRSLCCSTAWMYSHVSGMGEKREEGKCSV
ncbi:hypothetical protein DM02DRAFT_617598 [Periconia macrospinosa]|uniref:Uncharacterized protein n=1 Tax=Periconia macrospinosa TaxID=97972 RepID=A0A2V1DFC3_9PLEO|nr:hypothetical protein DM02DRAFT_617598 [Periconia macrospinosa]